jgi:acyl carrier protein
MNRDNILEGLKEIFKQIKPNLDLNTVTEQTRLIEDLGLDSLTILLLSFAIEKKFEFKFDGAPKFASVGEVMDYIEKHTA